MRLLSVFIITLCLISTTSLAQPDKELSEVDRLFYTCKIWGFLKYYHPLMGRGAYDWDQKLQDVLDRTAGIKTYEGFSTYMYRFLYAMGPLKPCTTCRQRSPYEPFKENFDLSWTQSNVFSDELKKFFKNIENNRFQGNHYYISEGKGQQFEPKNEKPDYDFIWKDRDERLLPLFRYWNYIEYFAPYKYLTDQSWDDVLKEMIPKFQAVETKLDLHLAILELVVKVDDTHSGLLTPIIEEWPYYNYLSVRIEMIENQIVVTEIIDSQKAQLNDLKVGDIIAKVDNERVLDRHNANKKYIWGSNDAVKDRSIYHTLFMGLQGTTQITIERNGSAQDKNITLYQSKDLSYTNEKTPEKWTTIEDSISYQVSNYDSLYNPITYDSIGYVKMGYVNLGQVGMSDVDGIMSELVDGQAIIFDVRNYPKGTYRAIAKYLNPTKTTFATLTKPDLSYPGKFVWQGERSCGEDNPDYFKGKVVLLVNENTQSHAEFTCMCLQTAPNVVTIGSQTAGTNSNVSELRIIQRVKTSLSGVGVYYADGRPTQREGIVIDELVKPTLTGTLDGRDELLERAIEIVLEEVEREEIARLEEVARLREIARLEALERQQQMMDSLRMDSLQMNMLKLDSLEAEADQEGLEKIEKQN